MTQENKLRTIPFDDEAAIREAIWNRDSFEIGGCQGRMSDAVKFVERAIGSEGMTSRVYTRWRAAVLLVGLANPAVGVATAGSLIAHRLATNNPDYEVIKRRIDGALRVLYVRDDPSLAAHVKGAAVWGGRHVAGAAEQVAGTVGGAWDTYVPTQAQVASAYEALLPRRTGTKEGDAETEIEKPHAEMAETAAKIRALAETEIEKPHAEMAETAAKIRALEEKLNKAKEHYADHNKTNEFIVCLFAIGAAMAACDGDFHDDEEEVLKAFVLGISAAQMPSSVKSAIDTLVSDPPSFEDALAFVERLDRAVWPLIDELLEAVSGLDGVVSQEEVAFIERWQAYKEDHAPA